MISVAPKPSERKNAHSCETPRSFGLTEAIASAVASLAAVARSPTASLAAEARSPIAALAAVARSPIDSALLRSSSMSEGYPRSRRPTREPAFADFGELTQLGEEPGGFGTR